VRQCSSIQPHQGQGNVQSHQGNLLAYRCGVVAIAGLAVLADITGNALGIAGEAHLLAALGAGAVQVLAGLAALAALSAGAGGVGAGKEGMAKARGGEVGARGCPHTCRGFGLWRGWAVETGHARKDHQPDPVSRRALHCAELAPAQLSYLEWQAHLEALAILACKQAWHNRLLCVFYAGLAYGWVVSIAVQALILFGAVAGALQGAWARGIRLA